MATSSSRSEALKALVALAAAVLGSGEGVLSPAPFALSAPLTLVVLARLPALWSLWALPLALAW